MTTKTTKYIEIRIDQLTEELEKNPSQENTMIFHKAIDELYIVLDMLKRYGVEPCDDCNPYKGVENPYYSGLP